MLLEPILPQGSIAIIYSATNVGKTWLALAIGLAVSKGGALFQGWRAPRSNNVLFLDFEAGENSLSKRAQLLRRMHFEGRKLPSRGDDRFHALSLNRGLESMESFKKEVAEYVVKNRIRLVILDNLTAFTQHNDSARAWERIQEWLDTLKEHGCSSLLLHHANKTSQMRGTSASANAVDVVIKLTKITEIELHGPSLGLRIDIEKGRDIFGEAKVKKYIEICPQEKPPQLISYPNHRPMTAQKTDIIEKPKPTVEKSNRKKHIKDSLESRNSIKSISEEIGVSPGRIYQLIQGDETLKQAFNQYKNNKTIPHQEIWDQYKANQKPNEIAQKYNITYTGLMKILERIGLNMLHQQVPNTGNVNSEIICSELGIKSPLATRISRRLNEKLERDEEECKIAQLLKAGASAESAFKTSTNISMKRILQIEKNLESKN